MSEICKIASELLKWYLNLNRIKFMFTHELESSFSDYFKENLVS